MNYITFNSDLDELDKFLLIDPKWSFGSELTDPSVDFVLWFVTENEIVIIIWLILMGFGNIDFDLETIWYQHYSTKRIFQDFFQLYKQKDYSGSSSLNTIQRQLYQNV